MALNNFTASVLSRSDGGTAVGRAAYNGRCRLMDERTGNVWDYSKRLGLEWSGIFAPSWAPEWASDRQKLTNQIELKEDTSKRRDSAQLMRDFKVALPFELTKEQRQWLVTDFVRQQFQRKGMVAIADIHFPDPHSDERNFHAHFLVTMREISEDGFGWKQRKWNQKEQLELWKERWSHMGAKALERAGFVEEAARFRVGQPHFHPDQCAARGDGDYAAQYGRGMEDGERFCAGKHGPQEP